MSKDGLLVETDAEVEQTDASVYPSFPVEVVGPVKTQSLPRVSAGLRRVTFTNGTDVLLILADNPMRASATIKIITDGGIFHFGERQSDAQADTAPLWSGSEPLVWNCRNALYATAPVATAVAPIVLTVITENWAQ